MSNLTAQDLSGGESQLGDIELGDEAQIGLYCLPFHPQSDVQHLLISLRLGELREGERLRDWTAQASELKDPLFYMSLMMLTKKQPYRAQLFREKRRERGVGGGGYALHLDLDDERLDIGL